MEQHFLVVRLVAAVVAAAALPVRLARADRDILVLLQLVAGAGATAEDLTQLANPEVITFKAQEEEVLEYPVLTEVVAVVVGSLGLAAAEVLEQILYSPGAVGAVVEVDSQAIMEVMD